MLKILVPIDGSEQSERIISKLLKYTSLFREGAEIHVLNVQHPVPYGSRISSVVGHDKIQQYHHDEGMAALKSSVAALDAAKANYKQHIGVGDAAETIIKFAKDKGCDQIFMGTHGMGAASGLILGSVATKVVHLSPMPVTLVRE